MQKVTSSQSYKSIKIGVSEEGIIIKLRRSLQKTLRSYYQTPEAKTLF